MNVFIRIYIHECRQYYLQYCKEAHISQLQQQCRPLALVSLFTSKATQTDNEFTTSNNVILEFKLNSYFHSTHFKHQARACVVFYYDTKYNNIAILFLKFLCDHHEQQQTNSLLNDKHRQHMTTTVGVQAMHCVVYKHVYDILHQIFILTLFVL